MFTENRTYGCMFIMHSVALLYLVSVLPLFLTVEGQHVLDYSLLDYSVLGYDAMLTGNLLLTFWRILLLSSSSICF